VNGVGNVILHTTNGGLNWTQVPGDYSKELILLDLEAADETVIVSGGKKACTHRVDADLSVYF
jgi:photosystem II stability/assembly factor-like uncharacterized protein